MRTAMGFVWAFGMLAAPIGAQPAAECPANQWDFCGTGGSSTAPAEQVSCACDPVSASISYDLVAGTSGAGAAGSGELGSCAALTTEDVYSIVGPDAGGPVSITALVALDVDLYAVGSDYGCGSAQAGASLRSGTASQGAQFSVAPCGYGSFHQVLSLDLAHPVGEPFQVVVAAHSSCGANGSGQISASLTFAMPPGYRVTSCQGYSVAPVTPSRAVSWGGLKVRYR